MIFGSIKVQDGAIVTHRDTYDLASISVVSVRRPLLVPALLVGGGVAAFGFIFGDLLYTGETMMLVSGGIVSIAFGLWLGQLKLLSRDLRQSELVDAIWGSYTLLNSERRTIASHLSHVRHGRGAS